MSRWRQRRANALSECLAEAVGLFIADTRNRAQRSISPDYSWMGVWRMSGVDHSRALTRQYGYRRFPSRSGVRSHLPGERWMTPKYSG